MFKKKLKKGEIVNARIVKNFDNSIVLHVDKIVGVQKGQRVIATVARQRTAKTGEVVVKSNLNNPIICKAAIKNAREKGSVIIVKPIEF